MIEVLGAARWVHALGITLLHFIWEGAGITAVAAGLLAALRQARPQVRYLIACTALFGMMAAASGTLMVDLAAGQPGQLTAEPATRPTHVSSLSADRIRLVMPPAFSAQEAGLTITRPMLERALPVVVAVWGVGVLALTLYLLGGWLAVQRIRRRSARRPIETLQMNAQAIAMRLGIHRRWHLCESDQVAVPSVIGWIRPMVLVPASALAGLTPDQLEAILAHELAHVRRHDYLVNLLQTVVETLLFYHPAVWWISKCVRTEREQCCDELAVSVSGDRVAYVQALASLEELRTRKPAFALGATDGELLARIRRVLRLPANREPNTLAWLATWATIVCMFFAVAHARAQAPATPRHLAKADVALPETQASPEFTPAVVLAPAQTARPEPQTSTVSEDATIRGLEEEFRRAKVDADLSTLDRLWDDAFVEMNQNGNVRNKAQSLELWRTFRISSLDVTISDIRATNDVAIVTGSQTEVNPTGMDDMLFTRVWNKRNDGRWVLISASQFRDPRKATGSIAAGAVSPPPAIVQPPTPPEPPRRIPNGVAVGTRRALRTIRLGIVPPAGSEALVKIAEGDMATMGVPNRGEFDFEPAFPFGNGAAIVFTIWQRSPTGVSRLGQAAVPLDGTRVESPTTPSFGLRLFGGVSVGENQDGSAASRNAGVVYTPGGDVTWPTPIAQHSAQYTEEARQANIQGEVHLEAVVGPTGHVDQILVTKSLDPGLDQAAIDAASQWVFKPATRNGTPVAVAVEMVLAFRLHK